MEDWARGSLTVCNVHGGAGVLYFWGMNNHGGEATMYPKPIQDLTGWNVRDIGCSNKSIVVLADESTISWGPHPTYGELVSPFSLSLLLVFWAEGVVQRTSLFTPCDATGTLTHGR